MITLKNDTLRIDLIDPRDPADQPLLGWRFAHGGLIWQVHDRKLGPLLTGPEWPQAKPSPFNAQGLPESFRHRTRNGDLLTWNDGKGVAIGSGEVAFDRAGLVFMSEPCPWFVEPFEDYVLFKANQSVAGFQYDLERKVALQGRTIIVTSHLTNTSKSPLKLEWFMHPFFALTDGFIKVKLPRSFSIPENPGFSLDNGVLTLKRCFDGTNDGHLEAVAWPPKTPCEFEVNHPILSGIKISLDAEPFECLLWGNGNTFSVEPYIKLEMAAGKSLQWAVRYEFGQSKKST